MKEIEELISTSDKYKNITVQKKFDSKKNTVAYVTIDDKPRVLKWFVPGYKRQMKTEYSILKKGSTKINIPVIHELDEENNVIIMSYITGKNICDIINDDKTENKEKQKLMYLLAEWLIDFHNFYKTQDQFIIRGDASLRNFIFTDRIWGVDFEESRRGKPVEDIAGLCSSILTTDPMFTPEKFRLCNIFIESYLRLASVKIDNINDEIAYSLLEKIQYRPDDEKIFREYSKKIKKEGLK